MQDFLTQIEATSALHLYYLALFGALAIPDICGSLEARDGRATRSSYIAWTDQNIAPRWFGLMTGQDCYQFRCSMLHQATTQHPDSRYSRILFVEPGATTNISHLTVTDGVLEIDVSLFCRDMISAARAWLLTVEGTEPYETNRTKLITRYPEGLAPFIVGVPVIG